MRGVHLPKRKRKVFILMFLPIGLIKKYKITVWEKTCQITTHFSSGAQFNTE